MGDDFGSRVDRVVCVLPAPGFDPAFDVHGLTFVQGLLARLGQVSPRHNVKPVRLCRSLAFGRSAGACHDDAKRRDGLAGWCIAHFWPTSKMADQRHPVQTSQKPLVHSVFRLDIRAKDHVLENVFVQLDGSL